MQLALAIRRVDYAQYTTDGRGEKARRQRYQARRYIKPNQGHVILIRRGGNGLSNTLTTVYQNTKRHVDSIAFLDALVNEGALNFNALRPVDSVSRMANVPHWEFGIAEVSPCEYL